MEQNTTNDQAIENLKKNAARWRLAAVILGIACVVLVVYANVQKAIAEENLIQANIARAEAEKQKKVADANAIKAQETAKLAEELAKAPKK